MKNLKKVIIGACGESDRCKINLSVFAKMAGLTIPETYRTLCEWNESGVIKLSEENGDMWLKTNWNEK